MKQKLTLLIFLFSAAVFAQSPKLINYQGVVRGVDGAPVLNQQIGLQFEILQGSATGSVAYSEQQTIPTNSLGLLLTQIGLKQNLSVLSWKNGPYFLRVSADVQGGTAYVPLNTQQIVGVPFSFHASTVPGAYTASTNVLDIGGNTFTLASTPNTTLITTGIATATTITTNSIVLDVPAPTFSANGPVNVSGTYPNLTVNSPPVTTLTSAGIATVSSAGTNSFVVGVPNPTYTSNGPVSISGAYPNMTVNAPPTTSVGGTGIVVVTSPGTNTYVVAVPQTSITVTNSIGAGVVTPVGTNSFNINIPAGVTPSMSGVGAAVVAPLTGNSFTVTVPQTSVTLTQTGTTNGISPAGTNSFNINIPANITPTISGAGAAVISPTVGNTFTVNVPQTNLVLTQTIGANALTPVGTNSYNLNVAPQILTQVNSGGGITISNPGTNTYVLTVPPTTITQAGAVNVTTGANNTFTVGVPGTSITQSGAAIVTSAGTNTFNVNVPTTSLTTSGVVTISPSGTNTFNIGVPGTSVTSSGAAIITTAGTNTFNVAVPGTSVTGAGAAIITTAGTNTFNVSVPATSVTGAGAAIITTAGTNTFNVSVPGTSVTGTGVAAITTAGTNSFNVSVPQSSVVVTTSTAAPGYTSTGTNSVVINIPPDITPTLTPAGLVNINTSGYSYTVNVPVLTYTGTTGVLASGTNTVNISPVVTLNSNTLTVGAASNSITLGGILPWRQATGAVTLATASDKVGIGGTAPTENLQIETAANTTVSILGGASNSSELYFGTTALHNKGRLKFDNSTSAMSLWTGTTTAAATWNSTGQEIIGTNSPFAATTGLTISRNGAFNNQLMITGGDNTNFFGGILSFAENLNTYNQGMSLKLDAGANRLVFTNDLTGSTPVASIGGYSGATNGVVVGTGYAGGINPPSDGLLVQGNVGIGSINPGTKLEVIGDVSIPNGNRIIFGTASSGSGIGEWIQNSSNGLQFNTASVPRINITAGGNVGIGTTAPISPLHVFGATTHEGNVDIGTSPTTPNDLRVYGGTRMGNETGTTIGPNYPFGSTGMIVRRVFNTTQVSNDIMAATDQLRFERDGTFGGFRINNLTGSGNEVCNCMGTNNLGVSVNRAFNNLVLGTTAIYTNADNMVFFHCIFGDPFNAGHITEINLTRQFADWFWMGTITTTFNQ